MEGTLKEIGAGPIRRRVMDLARWGKSPSLGRPNMKASEASAAAFWSDFRNGFRTDRECDLTYIII